MICHDREEIQCMNILELWNNVPRSKEYTCMLSNFIVKRKKIRYLILFELDEPRLTFSFHDSNSEHESIHS